MKVYVPNAHGFSGAEASQLRARCPICGRLYPLDIAAYVLSGNTLDGGPADDPLCPDCALESGKNGIKE